MKKVYLLGFLFINLTAFAQPSFRAHLGINTNKLNYQSVQGQIQGSTGLTFGGDVQFGKKFYIQPGVNYSAKKFTIENVGEIRANKFNIPVLFGYRFHKPKNTTTNNIRVYAGPNFSTTISEKISATITDISKDDLKNFNVGAIGGVGFDFRMFFLDIGYKYDLNDFIKKNDKTATLNGFLVNLGVRF